MESAIANAEHNFGADIDELRVTSIYVEKAATLRRFSARAKGRGARIGKADLPHLCDSWRYSGQEITGDVWDRKLIQQASAFL